MIPSSYTIGLTSSKRWCQECNYYLDGGESIAGHCAAYDQNVDFDGHCLDWAARAKKVSDKYVKRKSKGLSPRDKIKIAKATLKAAGYLGTDELFNVRDIIDYAHEQMNPPMAITNRQAWEISGKIPFDANVGINWDTIHDAIQWWYSELPGKEKKKLQEK